MKQDDPTRAAWEDYSHRQEFEHNLIDRKVSWFLTTQSIMFAAYGLASGQAAGTESAKTFQTHALLFCTIVALIGIVLGIVTFIGVGAVIISKWLSFRGYKAYCTGRKIPPPEPHAARKVQWGVNTTNTLVTLLPDVLTPLLFAAGWICLLSNNLTIR